MFFNIFFRYKKKEKLFNNMGIELYENKVNVICGHNGAGKTTLLKVISGILPSGLTETNGWYVPPTGGLILHFTLKEHLKILQIKEADKQIVQEAIDLFDATSFERKTIGSLSTGQTMMAAIIVAIASGNDLLLLDEPFGSLDPINAEKLSILLKKIVAHGRTVLITSHDLYLASETADVIYFIKNGEISWSSIQEDSQKNFTVEELKEKYINYA